MRDSEPITQAIVLPRSTGLRLHRPSEDDLRRASAALDVELARPANMWSDVNPKCARLAPAEWLIIDGPTVGEIAYKLRDVLHHAQDLTAGKVGWAIQGLDAATFIANGCSLDLHPSAFPPRTVIRTLIAQIPALLSRPGQMPLFEIVIDRSYQAYFELWLADTLQHRD